MNKPCFIILLGVTTSIVGWKNLSDQVSHDVKSFLAQDLEANGPSNEDREKIKRAAAHLENITYEIKEDDASVSIIFKGFTELSKDQVKVIYRDAGWFGTISLKEGRIEFYINAAEWKVTDHVELRKEEQGAMSTQKVEKAYYTHSKTSSKLFRSAVDVNTLKGEVKPKEFILTMHKYKTVPRQKEEVLHLS